LNRRTQHIISSLESIGSQLQSLRALCHPPVELAIQRLELDSGAIAFHLERPPESPPLVAIVGGTGTGKSTLLNRLIGAEVSASSFKRTFTAGAVAVTANTGGIPGGWLDLPHDVKGDAQSELPVRGSADRLSIVIHASDLTDQITLIDTPDVDGDQPLHHQQADRVFRWCDAVVFLVTPEKYQMTELRPYYRLAQRYAIASLYVMNKVDEAAPAEDFAKQVGEENIFIIARDDAAFETEPSQRIEALREALTQLHLTDPDLRNQGINARVSDWLSRVKDQVLEPLREDRRTADQLIEAISAMETITPGVDVNPLTRQLQRRLQQRSVLYLMGPGKLFDRVRQVPGLLSRLPRTAWDLMRHGQLRKGAGDDLPTDFDGRVPDFQANLIDQFTIIQSRIEDAIRSVPAGERWVGDAVCGFADQKISVSQAGQIAMEELANLRGWLEKHWDTTPRDTRVLKALLKVLPGAAKLTKWSEAAPYILAVVVATHHAFFGPVDLLILGGFSLATWLSEKISNEVASRARQTNTLIANRFTRLAHEQIRKTCDWLNSRVATVKQLQVLEASINELHEQVIKADH